MTLNQMKIFAEICLEGSVTKAAQKLYIAQSAASRTMHMIEKQYGYILFERVNGTIKPTSVALTILEDIIPILKQSEELEDRLMNKGYTPSLKVGCNIGIGEFLVQEIIKVFKERFPNTKLYITENNAAAIEKKILSGELDLGIYPGNVSNSKLIQERIDQEELFWICRYDNPILEEKEVSLSRLSEEPLYLPSYDVGGLEMLRQSEIEQGVELKPVYSLISHSVATGSVLQGLGISLGSYKPLKQYLESGIIRRIPAEIKLTRDINVVYLCKKRLNNEMKGFIEICKAAAI